LRNIRIFCSVPDRKEREELRKMETCAEDISERKQEETESGEEEEGAAKRKDLGGRSPTAFAEGVRFGALSAPGPSGLRPEHLKAFGSCRKGRSRREYERAMREFVAMAVRGELPESCWWLTDTAVTLVRKPGATPDAAPRPLRVGETLKRFVAKRIAAAERGAMQKLFARRRQYGVACPGGTEILLHHRLVSCRGEDDRSVGEWDLDIRNCYGSLYWGAIDASVKRHVGGALPWTRWMHSRAVRVLLPGGLVHTTRRGAEQGDPLGAMFAAAVIVDVCAEAERMAGEARRELGGQRPSGERMAESMVAMIRKEADRGGMGSTARAMLSAHADQVARTMSAGRTTEEKWNEGAAAASDGVGRERIRTMDVWYIDDAYVRGDLVDTDLWVAAWDAIAVLTGMERNVQKSFFKAPADDVPTPPYTALTCTRRPPGNCGRYLGVELQGQDEQYQRRVAEVAKVHQALRALDDAALELLLIRQCVDAGRITYLLRAVGSKEDDGETGVTGGGGTAGRVGGEGRRARIETRIRDGDAGAHRVPRRGAPIC
jgi:hypothetical protein